mgnify:CR=1 FL=1
MAKDDLLKFEGEVTDLLPNANFRVKLENDHEIIATLAGKLRRFNIRVALGDKVDVEMSPYDLARGRIVYRTK